MKKIARFILIALFFSSFSFCQTETAQPLSVDKLNIQFFLKDNVSYYLDSTRRLPFRDIKKLPFKKSSNPLLQLKI